MKHKKKIGRVIHRVHGPDYNPEKAKEIQGEMKQEEIQKYIEELTARYKGLYFHEQEENFYYKVPAGLLKKYDKFYFWFLSDIQLGNLMCNWEKLMAYIAWGCQTPNLIMVLGADLQDNNIPEHIPQAMWSQIKHPREQRELLKRALWPLRHKILFGITGNHELRTFYKTNEDPAELLCKDLGIPFRGFGGYLTVDIGVQKYIMAMHHGASASRTNMWVDCDRLKKNYPEAELFLAGHNHFLGDKRTKAKFTDPAGKEPFIWKDVVYVRTGSFLEYGGYAEAAIMEPQKTGSAIIKLYKSKHMIDVSTSDKIGSGTFFK